jgi:hypothetical protein
MLKNFGSGHSALQRTVHRTEHNNYCEGKKDPVRKINVLCKNVISQLTISNSHTLNNDSKLLINSAPNF